MKSKIKIEDFLTVGQVAKMLGKCTKTIRKWHASGKLVPHGVHPVTKSRFYYIKDILKFMKNKT